jgi:hypothetical protein
MEGDSALVARVKRQASRTIIASTLLILNMSVGSVAWADPAPVPLSYFEGRVDNSLAVRAAGAGVEADQAVLQSALDRSGMEFAGVADIGPHHEVVAASTQRSYFRYGQTLGVRWPIFGTQELQQQAIVAASTQRTLGGLTYQGTRQQIVGALRANYIGYWAARQEMPLAQSFINELSAAAVATRSLRTSGFWTQADTMRYSSMLEKAKIDLSHARLDQQNDLMQLAAITGSPVAPFMPVEPGFGTCSTGADAALASALRSDVDLAKFNALAGEAHALGGLQHYTGVDANLNLGVLTSYEWPGGLGYGLVVGISVGLPTRVQRVQGDEARRTAAQYKQYGLLAQQRQAQLTTDVEVAVANRDQAMAERAQVQKALAALEEDLREARIRLTTIAPDTLADTQAKAEAAYHARIASIEAEAAVLLRVNDLLQIAPDACSAQTAVATPALEKQ